MKKIAFLGGGKIGRNMMKHVQENGKAEVAFVYDPFLKENDLNGIPVVKEVTDEMLEGWTWWWSAPTPTWSPSSWSGF